MISIHLKKLRKRTDISSEEERAIRNAVAETRHLPADEVVIHAGEELICNYFEFDRGFTGFEVPAVAAMDPAFAPQKPANGSIRAGAGI